MRAVTDDPFPASYSDKVRQVGAINRKNKLLTDALARLLDGPAALRSALIRKLIMEEFTLEGVLRDEEQLEAFCRKAAVGVWHASCTCRMGDADDPMAVTDPAGRVRGVEGLRVVDASIFPGGALREHELPDADDGGEVRAGDPGRRRERICPTTPSPRSRSISAAVVSGLASTSALCAPTAASCAAAPCAGALDLEAGSSPSSLLAGERHQRLDRARLGVARDVVQRGDQAEGDAGLLHHRQPVGEIALGESVVQHARRVPARWPAGRGFRRSADHRQAPA